MQLGVPSVPDMHAFTLQHPTLVLAIYINPKGPMPVSKNYPATNLICHFLMRCSLKSPNVFLNDAVDIDDPSPAGLPTAKVADWGAARRLDHLEYPVRLGCVQPLSGPVVYAACLHCMRSWHRETCQYLCGVELDSYGHPCICARLLTCIVDHQIRRGLSFRRAHE